MSTAVLRPVIVSHCFAKPTTPGGPATKLPDTHAKFHQWGVDYQEFESGSANYTVAVVEFESGKVELVHPTHIRFLTDRELIPKSHHNL